MGRFSQTDRRAPESEYTEVDKEVFKIESIAPSTGVSRLAIRKSPYLACDSHNKKLWGRNRNFIIKR